MIIARAILPWRPSPAHIRHLHFRGWFRTSVLGKKIELYNFNTELETCLFWTKSIAQVETSLVCFTALAKISAWILDVGANTGVFAIAASRANEKAHTYAIEPNFSNFTALQWNVNRNQLPVSCLNVAATSENKLVTLWDFSNEISYSASLEHKFRDGQGAMPVNVVGIKVDQILINVQPSDLILAKIDVETHEAEVLRGMPTALKNDRQMVLLIEVIRDGVGRDLGHLLPPGRFVYFQVTEESRELQESKELTTFDGFNYLVVSRNILAKVVDRLRTMDISVKFLAPSEPESSF